MTHIQTITVSSKGQVVIPEEVRKELAIRAGTRLVLIEKDDRIILQKEKKLIEKLESELTAEEKERLGWMLLAEKSMAKIWSDPKEDEVWARYL